MLTVYGIKNCDTVRKARKWLADRGVAHRYHDFRTDGLDRACAARWVRALGRDTVLNRRGTTWRQLSEHEREIADDEAAVDLLTLHPALVKRPVFEIDGVCKNGFSSGVQAELQSLIEAAVAEG